jgi:hypothetical protein
MTETDRQRLLVEHHAREDQAVEQLARILEETNGTRPSEAEMTEFGRALSKELGGAAAPASVVVATVQSIGTTDVSAIARELKRRYGW